MMFNNGDNAIPAVFLETINDTEIEDSEVSLTWDGFVRLMSDFRETPDKEDVGGIMPVKMKPKEHWKASEKGNYRIDDNVESITMAAIDIDTEGAIDKAKETFSDFDYIIHSTHSRTKETPYKYRMFIRLDNPIPVSEWKPLFLRMVYPVEADLSCSNSSRGYYLPSYHPECGLKPYFEHNEGRPLTIEDIHNIGKEYEKALEKEAIETGNEDKLEHFRSAVSRALSSNKPNPVERIHPAGGVVKDAITYSKIDLSYEGYKKRHQERINNYLHQDHRSSFSLETTYQEMNQFKDHTDIPSLIKFIARASLEESSKGLHDPTSDTFEEIPRHIQSAFKKIGGFNQSIEDIRDQIWPAITESRTASMQAAQRGSSDDIWKFPEKPKEIGKKRKNSIMNTDFESMKKDHKDLIKQYMNDGDWTSMTKKLLGRMDAENSGKGLYHGLRFSLYVMDGCHRTVFKQPIRKNDYDNKINEISNYLSQKSGNKAGQQIAISAKSYEPNMKTLKANQKPENGQLEP